MSARISSGGRTQVPCSLDAADRCAHRGLPLKPDHQTAHLINYSNLGNLGLAFQFHSNASAPCCDGATSTRQPGAGA